MKVLIAPSAYKGTMSPLQVAEAIATGIARAKQDFEVECLALADGGDGTIEVLHNYLGGELISVEATGATSKLGRAHWLKLENLAVVELASVCGIGLLAGEKLEPLKSHTLGLGQVIKHCLDYAPKRILIALGGSASTDGGTGALTALGARFLDADGKKLSLGGGALTDLATIDLTHLDEQLSQVSIDLAADIESPLLGPTGAAYTFAPQKGANPDDVITLELGLSQLSDVFEGSLRYRLKDVSGVGAAGGTAYGLVAGLGAKLKPGFSTISQMLNLKDKIEDSDLVITAEAKLDRQSFQGKATGQLAKMCQALGRPLWVIPAQLEAGLSWTRFGIERVMVCVSQGRATTKGDLITASEKIVGSSIAFQKDHENFVTTLRILLELPAL